MGFDREIYFANEESVSPNTFDGKGGLAVAVFDNEAHGLTALGHFAWENALVQPGTGKYTVIMSDSDLTECARLFVDHDRAGSRKDERERPDQLREHRAGERRLPRHLRQPPRPVRPIGRT